MFMPPAQLRPAKVHAYPDTGTGGHLRVHTTEYLDTCFGRPVFPCPWGLHPALWRGLSAALKVLIPRNWVSTHQSRSHRCSNRGHVDRRKRPCRYATRECTSWRRFTATNTGALPLHLFSCLILYGAPGPHHHNQVGPMGAHGLAALKDAPALRALTLDLRSNMCPRGTR